MLAISTMGFRGEALAAISAVSKVDIFTKNGNRHKRHPSLLRRRRECHMRGNRLPKGHDGHSQGYFFNNVPARMKFLKKWTRPRVRTARGSHIGRLSHPEISFKFVKDGRESFFHQG